MILRLLHTLRRSCVAAALVLGAAVFLSPSAARSQTVDDGGLWFALFTQGDLHKDACSCHDIKWWFDGHLRFLDDADGFNQSIVRPGIGMTLTDRLTVWAGYGWIHTDPLSGAEFDEHRIWQQTTWSRDLCCVTLSLRSRLEQRFVETGDDVGLRYRQLVRLHRPLLASPRFTVVAWDEAFFHLNDTDWGANAGFDQNRAFAGFGWKYSPDSALRTEIGYLNQTIDTAGSGARINHILSINFFR